MLAAFWNLRCLVQELSTIYDYMRSHAAILGERILQEYPALQRFDDPVSARLRELLREPFPAQAIAIMGLAKRWQQARTAMVVAECGTGKTLISLGGIHVHSDGEPFTALAMVPPHLVEKWAREAFLTLPGIRVFVIDDFCNGGDENRAHGVNEVRLRKGGIVREGMHTTLSELRLRRDSPSSRRRWMSLCGRPSLFIVGRERAKLGYFWRHAYQLPRSGPYMGCVVNADTGRPVVVESGRLTAADFENVKLAELIERRGDKRCRQIHSPLWQADSDKIRRMAPIEFIGRYMPGWFDYAICDEVHQLAGDTAQGNALGTLAACANRIVGLTGTLLGGFADDLFNTLFRLEAGRMKEHGYEWGATGRSSFTQDYGVLETNYISVPMDDDMREAYRALEDDIQQALKKRRGNRSVLSTMLNTLLLYPDHPYGVGTLYGTEFDGELKRKVKFVIAETRDLPQDRLYSKERRLIQEIKTELAEGRRCQVFAVYTHEHDVTARLQHILGNEGIRSAVLRASVDTSKREACMPDRSRVGFRWSSASNSPRPDFASGPFLPSDTTFRAEIYFQKQRLPRPVIGLAKPYRRMNETAGAAANNHLGRELSGERALPACLRSLRRRGRLKTPVVYRICDHALRSGECAFGDSAGSHSIAVWCTGNKTAMHARETRPNHSPLRRPRLAPNILLDQITMWRRCRDRCRVRLIGLSLSRGRMAYR